MVGLVCSVYLVALPVDISLVSYVLSGGTTSWHMVCLVALPVGIWSVWWHYQLTYGLSGGTTS